MANETGNDYQKLISEIEAAESKLTGKSVSHEEYRTLAGLYRKAAEQHMWQRSIAEYMEALIYLEKDINLASGLNFSEMTYEDQKSIVFDYKNLGIVYNTLGGKENNMKAVENFERELDLRRKIMAEGLPEDQKEVAVRHLGECYERLAGVHKELGGFFHNRKAEDYLNRKALLLSNN